MSKSTAEIARDLYYGTIYINHANPSLVIPAIEEVLNAERNAHDALVAALRSTARQRDYYDGELCWCPNMGLLGEAHITTCLTARAALARVEDRNG